jgi:hypothetical protein
MAHKFQLQEGRRICANCGDEKGIDIERRCPFPIEVRFISNAEMEAQQAMQHDSQIIETESAQMPSSADSSSSKKRKYEEFRALVGESPKAMFCDDRQRRIRYDNEEKCKCIDVFNSLVSGGRSMRSSIKEINTIPGFEKVTVGMIQRWVEDKPRNRRGPKVHETFEQAILETLRERGDAMGVQSRDALGIGTGGVPDQSQLVYTYENVRTTAQCVRSTRPEFSSSQKLKELSFSTGWVAKFFVRHGLRK